MINSRVYRRGTVSLPRNWDALEAASARVHGFNASRLRRRPGRAPPFEFEAA